MTCDTCHGTGIAWRYYRHPGGDAARSPYPCACQGGSWRIPGTEFIEADPECCGGRPVLRGSRFAVRHVIGYLRGGYTPALMARDWPHIPRVAFEEVERLLREGTWPEEFWENPFIPGAATAGEVEPID